MRVSLAMLALHALGCSPRPPTAPSAAPPATATDRAPAPPTPGDESVAGGALETCSTAPLTGFFRDGRCVTGPSDHGTHVVCAEVTDTFLSFTRTRGNDLQSPRPAHRFPGLRAGDRWCLCALRWREALEAGVAPPVVLAATHRRALDFVSLDALHAHRVQPTPPPAASAPR